MKSFTLGALALYLAALAYNLVNHDYLRFLPRALLARYVIIACIIPLVALVGAAAFIRIVRPRRALQSQRPLSLSMLSRGAAAALLGITLATAAPQIGIGLAERLFAKVEKYDPETKELIWCRFSLPEGELPDMIAAALGGFTAAAVILLTTTRRLRPGTCLLCAYDISHSLSSPRCPECGTAI